MSVYLINLLIGVLMGVAMSVPVGPGGVIGVKRTIARGFWAGMASGFGIALGDWLFASVALLGISAVSDFITGAQYWLQILGGMIIIIVGVSGLLKGPQLAKPPRTLRSLKAIKDTSSMLLLTLANPQTIIGFSTLFAATASFYTLERESEAVALAAGVFLGSLTMWVAVSWGVSHWRGVMQDAFIAKLHRIASWFVIIIGILLLSHALLLG